MLFYYCWFNAELVLHSRADRWQLFSLAKWSCLLSVRPPPPPPFLKACMWVSTSPDWITVAWEQKELGLIMLCLSGRFGDIFNLRAAWTNVTMLLVKKKFENECASQGHEEEEEDLNRLLKSVSTPKLLPIFLKWKGLNLLVNLSLNVMFLFP